ncbi:IS110 family transposase [bacterium]|jgi:transposase|nr:IS110 family transposase [bacterium]
MSQTTQQPSGLFYIGIDFHKHYSVFCVIDGRNTILERGRIDHKIPTAFELLIKRYPGCRVVFETTMNWHWLYEVLEAHLDHNDIVLANAYKTRIIAEAQVKTDKVDAHILAKLLRGDLISTVHIPSKSTRERKEVLRQRCFFVRQRTMLRNRIQRLLSAQHNLQLPQCSDLFGKKGISALCKLKLPDPAGLLLRQQLEVLESLKIRIAEDEATLKKMLEATPELDFVLSIPGMGPILAAVVVSEVDDISRFPSAQKLCGYAGLCPTTSSSGGKTNNGRLMRACNKWLRWAFVEAAWVSVGCSPYFGNYYKRKRTMGKKANTAIIATARLMARICWQLLTEKRAYESFPPAQKLQGQPEEKPRASSCSIKENKDFAMPKDTFPSRSD